QYIIIFFFSSRRRHTRCYRDWSSDVCSSDLEGEKAQPDWLFKFLRNPHMIRPITVLRMPKFNMSADDAQAIVNYFGAVDKTQNRSEERRVGKERRDRDERNGMKRNEA